MSQRVVVAMSGGVDSSVAAALLKEQGYDVIGVSMRLPQPDQPVSGSCCGIEGLEDARRVCGALDIPYYALDLREDFEREVIGYLEREYRCGRTPNPCVMCNTRMKWGVLQERARGLDAELIATGHYARIEAGAAPGWRQLLKGVDHDKDQSYFLFALNQAQLAQTLFPVGGFTKPEIRAHARRLGLKVHAKPGSQDICFVAGDYRDFFSRRAHTGPGFEPGPIVDMNGAVVGEHPGIAGYTIGQRRGIGAHSRRLYVVRIDAAANTVVIGEDCDLYAAAFKVADVNWIGRDAPAEPFTARVRIRYRHPEQEAVITPGSGREAAIEFREPQRAVTPGQAAVIYDGDTVVGGGWIE